MKSKVFDGDEQEFRSSVKKVPVRASEVASLIMYKGCALEEESQSKKPNNNNISKKDLKQKNTLTGLAKVYSQRIMKSQVSLNNY